ncbi:TetR/AcrR family transcriptional regulator [Amycolatopsis rhizosphaerae]|uniref:TetR/AcrR family transcriptional regulator n=1 Tax=Amycolatopsis rhizosphaerae TaxID=2053003 RepID=A0A558B9G2_9PSEU|nr:TetR family transcriptional regulator [Amycolatopsis rhizosphaerae]TVT33124.1 TetR/AcrR family transcriptional regulator [Amycolatopsis rhizosphaerae]
MGTLRERILDAGVELICNHGWDRVTMSQLARRVGVSRQMVYKEIGARDVLAKAIIGRHADRFLAGVVEHLHAHGADAAAGIGAAVDYVLRAAADDPLLKAVLGAPHVGEEDLLPLLTTNPEPVLARAVETVFFHARTLYADAGLSPDCLATLVEVVVRLTLSHLTQPSGPIEHAVAQAIWVVRGALQAPPVSSAAGDVP